MTTTAAPPAPGGTQSLLNFNPPLARKHLGILLYGPEGEGKSTAACTAPGPIIYCNADRPGAIRFAQRHFNDKIIAELPIQSRRELDDLELELRDGKHSDVQTVVLDSLGKIYDAVLADIAGGKQPSLPNRGDANTYIERKILGLLALPVHLVLVAHDNPVVVAGSEEEGSAEIELFPFTGTNNPGLGKKLMRSLDIVGYCGSRPVADVDKFENVADEDLPVYMQRDPDGDLREFVAQLRKSHGRRAKETTGVLPKVSPLNLTAWVDRIAAAYAAPQNPVPATSTEEKS